MSGTQSFPLQQPTSAATDHQALEFMIWSRLLRIQTTIVVQVIAVHGGGIGPSGTVDVQPCVNQIDGAGNAIPHGTIYGRPYSRVASAGGVNAVICDPVTGDFGVMVFASRDISAFITAASAGSALPVNPGSKRVFDYADGLYLGSLPLNGTPTNYVEFAAGNIVNISAGTVNITSTVGQTTIDGKTFLTHKHVPGTYVAGSTAVTGDSGSVM